MFLTPNAARVILAAIRIVNGAAALALPRVLSGRLEPGHPPDPVAEYAFRLFGVRTVLIGLDLITAGPGRAEAVKAAPFIHGSDTVAAAITGFRRDIPVRTAIMLTLISGLNTVLAVRANSAD